jgi:hypothetical protein
MLEIVWRNLQPPPRRMVRVAAVKADESTTAPMWVICYHTIVDSGRPENEYQLFVRRPSKRRIQSRRRRKEVKSCLQ